MLRQGKKMSLPRYYKKLLELTNSDYAAVIKVKAEEQLAYHNSNGRVKRKDVQNGIAKSSRFAYDTFVAGDALRHKGKIVVARCCMKLYCIYDKLAEEAGPVVEAKSDAVAVRQARKILEKNGLRLTEFRLFSWAIMTTRYQYCTRRMRPLKCLLRWTCTLSCNRGGDLWPR